MSVPNIPSTQRSSGTVRSDCGFLASPSTLLAVSDLPARRPDNSVNGLGTDSVPRSQQLNSLRSSIKEGHLTGALIPDSVSLPFKGIAGASCRADLPVPHISPPQVAFVPGLYTFSKTENKPVAFVQSNKGLGRLPPL